MERPTKKIELPISKKTVVLKEWISGGEKRKIASEEDNNLKLNLMIDTLVVSIDDKKENLPQVVDDLHGLDFDTIFKEITSIIEVSSLTEEKKSK